MRLHRGFTLIELAMVIFIIGMLLGGLLTPLSNRLEQENRTKTQGLLSDIEESLLGYAVINGRLPCPDCPDGNVDSCGAVAAANRNDGKEDRYEPPPPGSGNICRTSVGGLPWVDLGTHEYDAWERHFTYQVTLEFAREKQDGAPPPCGTPAVGVAFEICSVGDIDVYGVYTNPYGTPDIAENVPAIVISHGKDAYESSQSNAQVENYGRNPVNPDTGANILSGYIAANFTDNAFVSMNYRRSGSDIVYDDLLVWISPSILMNRMIISGKLP